MGTIFPSYSYVCCVSKMGEGGEGRRTPKFSFSPFFNVVGPQFFSTKQVSAKMETLVTTPRSSSTVKYGLSLKCCLLRHYLSFSGEERFTNMVVLRLSSLIELNRVDFVVCERTFLAFVELYRVENRIQHYCTVVTFRIFYISNGFFPILHDDVFSTFAKERETGLCRTKEEKRI